MLVKQGYGVMTLCVGKAGLWCNGVKQGYGVMALCVGKAGLWCNGVIWW